VPHRPLDTSVSRGQLLSRRSQGGRAEAAREAGEAAHAEATPQVQEVQDGHGAREAGEAAHRERAPEREAVHDRQHAPEPPRRRPDALCTASPKSSSGSRLHLLYDQETTTGLWKVYKQDVSPKVCFKSSERARDSNVVKHSSGRPKITYSLLRVLKASRIIFREQTVPGLRNRTRRTISPAFSSCRSRQPRTVPCRRCCMRSCSERSCEPTPATRSPHGGGSRK